MKPLPQIFLGLLWLASLLSYARDHGKPRTGKDNFWMALAVFSVQALILWWGGWFS